MRVIRMNMNIFYAFVVISFLNRFLNPFIYASQYEVVRRTWPPLVKLLRAHILGARELAPPAAEGIASISSHPADRQLSMSTQKLDVDGNKSPGRTMLQSTTFTEVRPAKRKTV